MLVFVGSYPLIHNLFKVIHFFIHIPLFFKHHKNCPFFLLLTTKVKIHTLFHTPYYLLLLLKRNYI